MSESVSCYQCGCDMKQRPTPDGEFVKAGLTLRDGTRIWRQLDTAGLPEWHCEICGLQVTDESRDDGYVYRYGVLFKDLIPLAMHPDWIAKTP